MARVASSSRSAFVCHTLCLPALLWAGATPSLSGDDTQDADRLVARHYVEGTAEDEAAIRELIDRTDHTTYLAPDVDWENAFGGRILERREVEGFMREEVRPGEETSQERSRVTVRFLSPTLALADEYWSVVYTRGQIGDDPKRVGRSTLLFSKGNDGDWEAILVRIADLRSGPVPKLAVEDAEGFAPIELGPEELARYEGWFEDVRNEGWMPRRSEVWARDGLLYSDTTNLGPIALAPIGDHRFVAGRAENGRFVEIYWPDEVQVFDFEEDELSGYRILEGDEVRLRAIRVDGP